VIESLEGLQALFYSAAFRRVILFELHYDTSDVYRVVPEKLA
jgi:hypothetical protein